MPMRLEEILANNQIIQYTPANVSDVHDRVLELFMKELEPGDEYEEELPEEIEEPSEEEIEDLDIPNEEGEENEEDEINP